MDMQTTAVIGYLLAFVAAIWGVHSANNRTKKKNSTEMLHKASQDNYLIQSYRIIHAIHTNDGDDIQAYVKKERADSDESKAIAYALNHWEYVAVGIYHDIYDDAILKQANYHSLTQLVKKTRGFIEAVNQGATTKTYYQDVCCLAKKWEDKPLKPKKPK